VVDVNLMIMGGAPCRTCALARHLKQKKKKGSGGKNIKLQRKRGEWGICREEGKGALEDPR